MRVGCNTGNCEGLDRSILCSCRFLPADIPAKCYREYPPGQVRQKAFLSYWLKLTWQDSDVRYAAGSVSFGGVGIIKISFDALGVPSGSVFLGERQSELDPSRQVRIRDEWAAERNRIRVT
jgi:hypothetical protein